MSTTRSLRASIARERRRRLPRKPRYSRQLREEIVSFAQEQRKQGIGLQAVAGELDLCLNTLRRWIERKPGPMGRPRRVRVYQEVEPSGSLILVTVQGHRVEGLDITTMAMLLRELS